MNLIYLGKAKPYQLRRPFEEGVIVDRPNRFIMVVDVNGKRELAHCPTTGKIGSIELSGRPVLLSASDNEKRRTSYTVEAISYDGVDSSDKEWIGINQAASNRYIEHFIRNGAFHWMVHDGQLVTREQKLGNSRIDLRVGDTYIEVKTPVQVIQKVIPDGISVKGHGKLSGGERLVKHVNELAEALEKHQRCVMLNCFQYIPDKDSEERYDNGILYVDAKEIMEAFEKAMRRGVECWTAVLRITPSAVYLVEYGRDD